MAKHWVEVYTDEWVKFSTIGFNNNELVEDGTTVTISVSDKKGPTLSYYRDVKYNPRTYRCAFKYTGSWENETVITNSTISFVVSENTKIFLTSKPKFNLVAKHYEANPVVFDSDDYTSRVVNFTCQYNNVELKNMYYTSADDSSSGMEVPINGIVNVFPDDSFKWSDTGTDIQVSVGVLRYNIWLYNGKVITTDYYPGGDYTTYNVNYNGWDRRFSSLPLENPVIITQTSDPYFYHKFNTQTSGFPRYEYDYNVHDNVGIIKVTESAGPFINRVKIANASDDSIGLFYAITDHYDEFTIANADGERVLMNTFSLYNPYHFVAQPVNNNYKFDHFERCEWVFGGGRDGDVDTDGEWSNFSLSNEFTLTYDECKTHRYKYKAFFVRRRNCSLDVSVNNNDAGSVALSRTPDFVNPRAWLEGDITFICTANDGYRPEKIIIKDTNYINSDVTLIPVIGQDGKYRSTFNLNYNCSAEVIFGRIVRVAKAVIDMPSKKANAGTISVTVNGVV